MSPSTSTSSISSSSSRQCPPPLVLRSTTLTTASTPLSSLIKQSQSADFSSFKSLLVSFHGELFSLPISKMKAAPTPNLANTRKTTPEQRRTTPLIGKIDGPGGIDQMENSKSIDQQRWLGRTRTTSPLTRKKLKTVTTFDLALAISVVLQVTLYSFISLCRFKPSVDLLTITLAYRNPFAMDANSKNGSLVPFDLTAFDIESVSSGRTSRVQERNGVSQAWETNSRLRHLQDPGLPLSTNTSSRMTALPKLISSKKPLSLSDSPISSPRTISTTGSRTLSDIGGLQHLS
uniref:Uncharacterized protein n=1 Tax=Nelumbo nucifera TaxID=4432 RepID=A0A822XPE0_NELNU|nr:TPA_asm: hypothetical protein HUJ06_022402 [Nelumbo nucifera]